MAAADIHDGHGASIAFASGGTNAGLSLTIVDIDLPQEVTEEINTSHLGVGTHQTKVAGSLKNIEDCTLTVVTNSDKIPVTGGSDDVTITFPLGDGESSAATLQFATCFVKSFSPGKIESNARMEGQVVLTISGDWDWTAAT